MKGISASMQIECDCGELVEVEHASTRLEIPALKQFDIGCQCGKRFFIHVQETKPLAGN